MPYKDPVVQAKFQRERYLRLGANKRSFILDHLTSHPCVDCGGADPIVLEFDHVRGVKLMSISDMITNKMSVLDT